MSYLSKLTWTLYTQDLSSQINSTTIIEGSEIFPKTNTSTLALSAGTYYVKISQHESATGKYKVNASFTSFNANDAGANTFDSPLVLPAATTINGALTYTDAEDWYRKIGRAHV